jgi:5-methylcytosine-specific restriction endonuclease McrA
MPYEEYLETPEWKTIRIKVYEQRRGRCEVCKRKLKGFQIHHKTYANKGCEHYSDLVLLCVNCHENKHKGK